MDQLTKFLVAKFSPDLIVYNFNGFWGIKWGGNQQILLLVLVVAALSYLAYSFRRSSGVLTGLVVILSGAVSNLLDRMFRHGVLDFIDLKIWPAFNLADTLIVIGVAFAIFALLRDR